MMRTGGGCFSITRICTDEVCVRRSNLDSPIRFLFRFVLQVKRVLRIAGRMIGGSVQRVEAMIFVLDFRAIGDDKTNLAKAAHDVLGDLRERMEPAQARRRPGKVKSVGSLGRAALSSSSYRRATSAFSSSTLDWLDQLSRRRDFLPWERAELLHQRGEPAVGAQVIDARLFQSRQIRGGIQFGEGRLFERFNLICKSHSAATENPEDRTWSRANKQKRATQCRPQILRKWQRPEE